MTEVTSRLPGAESPKLMIRETGALCLVLCLALAASKADQRFFHAWQGYPSSLLLILLSLWHQKHFRVRISWFRGKTAGKHFAFAIFLCLVFSSVLAEWFLGNLFPRPVSFADAPFARQFHLLLLVPISEELFFRGILLDHLKRGFSAFQATILCSALFMILHIPHGAGIEALALSILTCLLVLRSGMLLHAVQLHLAWNSFVAARHASSDVGWLIILIAALAILISAFIARMLNTSMPSDAISIRCHPPSLQENAQDRSLLIWGDLGQWLIVDREACELIRVLSEKHRIADDLEEYIIAGNLEEYIRCHQKAGAKAEAETLTALLDRGILAADLKPAKPDKEKLRIASLTFNITNRCNLRCPWCYNVDPQSRERPVSEVMNWIKQGRQALDENATFIILGGEPFFDAARLVETVVGARELFSGEILVSTNGTRFEQSVAANLAQSKVTVQVSLDSPHRSRHDALRGAGVYDQALATARQLAAAGVHTVFSMVLTRDSESEIEALFDLARENGAREVRFIPLRRIGKGKDYRENAPDLVRAFSALVSTVKRRHDLSRMLGRDFFSILMTVCRYSRHRSNCGIGRRVAFVDADGRIYPCPNHRRPDFCCGHISNTPLQTLLEDSPICRRARETYSLERLENCRDCVFRFWCAGDCRAEALAVSGNPAAPSPYCEELQRLMKDMFWLIADGWGATDKDNGAWSHWN
jgi:radical SAM protein with 4Fe4S-binding SPASM domain